MYILLETSIQRGSNNALSEMIFLDPWHAFTIPETLDKLNTTENGISTEEAENRSIEYGPNQLAEIYKPSKAKMFLRQFENYLIIVLIAASVISWISGETTNAYVILGIIFFISLIGFVQEYKAERAMEALRDMVAPEAHVLRDGKVSQISVTEIVPGDVIRLEAGDKVPADARIIDHTALEVVESSLTGESVSEKKSLLPVLEDASLGDRTCMVYMGTIVVYGNCKAAVTATGSATELGRISGLIQETPEDPPLKIKFQVLAKQLAFVVLAACAIIFAVEISRGSPLLSTLIIAAALAVAGIPESLPFVVTVTLAYGTQIMAKKNAIIRRLPAVETLGSTTVICTDKTGTLTRGEMTAREIWTDRKIEVTGSGYDPQGDFLVQGVKLDVQEEGHLETLLAASVLCNNSNLEITDHGWRVIGDPTEGALVVLAKKAGLLEAVQTQYKKVLELPFDSERKRMVTVHKSDSSGLEASMKGAPEIVLDFCSHVMTSEGQKDLTSKMRREILMTAEGMASEGLRLLAIARKELDSPSMEREDVETDLTFLGLVGMMDPPRSEAKDAIKVCKRAGIRPVMITGDHKLTAATIGKELGILDGEVLEGSDLEKMDDADLYEIIESVSVFARATAEHKVRIVKALKERGHVVAMTGDGVNDAPALKAADIGIAMGRTGTEVSKEASDMVIIDDNFATIVSAVEEGRRIYDNIRKASSYLLSCNFAEVMTIFLGVMLGLPVPLLALQILWINLVTDEFPAIGLSVEPAHSELMERDPRNPKESILTRGLFMYTLGISCVIFLGSLGLYALALEKGVDLPEARTTVFAALVIFELYNAYNSRSLTDSVFALNPNTNKKLMLGLSASVIALLAAIYLPFMQSLFKTAPLALESWASILVVASLVVVAAELFKRWNIPSRV